jgi:tryptophan synthase alpha chain
MNRIKSLFENKREGVLSVYYTAGFPSLHDTVAIAQHLRDAGVDIIEIGIPFSDPVADGPVIQMSNKQSLDQGMTLRLLLEQVKAIRESVQLPIVLMGYLNPVMQYGFEEFFRDAALAGVDGVILPDLPLEEYASTYQPLLKKHNLVNTLLVTPQTPEDRVRKMDQLTEGFLYAVSSSSTTGARSDFSKDQELYFQRLKKMDLKNPFLIGFGVSNASTFQTVCRYAAGAIVGSAFIRALSESKDLGDTTKKFVEQLKQSS